MIGIARRRGAPSLAKHQAIWTDELCAARTAYYKKLNSTAVRRGMASKPKKPKPLARRYASKAVKRALSVTFGKWCAYCGDILGANTFPRADHFRPHDSYPKLAFEWENLVQACEICNERKGDRFPLVDGSQPIENHRTPCAGRVYDASALVDPCTEDPADHFAWNGADVNAVSDRGMITRTTLDLCREDLQDQRDAEYDAFMVNVRLYQLALRGMHLPAEVEIARARVVRSLGPTGRFPAMKRAALAAVGLPLSNFAR